MMKIVDRGGFKMYVLIGDCKAPDETQSRYGRGIVTGKQIGRAHV